MFAGKVPVMPERVKRSLKLMTLPPAAASETILRKLEACQLDVVMAKGSYRLCVLGVSSHADADGACGFVSAYAEGGGGDLHELDL